MTFLFLLQGMLNQARAGALLGALEVFMEDTVAGAGAVAYSFPYLDFFEHHSVLHVSSVSRCFLPLLACCSWPLLDAVQVL
jgi:hypothetical protein